MAPNMDDVCRALAVYIGDRLRMQIEFVNQISWQERYRQLDAGDIQLAWICGAPYVRRMAGAEPTIELLVAPVWRDERYGNQPIYFSDVVVHRDSTFQRFADLRGATWVYNEPGSFSGYAAMRSHLAQLGLHADFFGEIIESGAHQQSLQMIIQRQADVTAIDSTVLEQALRTQPEFVEQIRIVDVIGPNPSPPWVIVRTLPAEIRVALRLVLTNMHEEPAGRALLAQGSIARFVPVMDANYDAVRTVLRLAATA
jgi:phosphonate transport system substrate-binding protein